MSDAPARDVDATLIACAARPNMALKHLVGLSLDGCDLFIACTRLNEFERTAAGLGHRLETWPAVVRKVLEDALVDYLARAPGVSVRAVTTGLDRDVAVLAVHVSKAS